MQTRMRSPAAHGPAIAFACMWVKSCSSTRSATAFKKQQAACVDGLRNLPVYRDGGERVAGRSKIVLSGRGLATGQVDPITAMEPRALGGHIGELRSRRCCEMFGPATTTLHTMNMRANW